MVLINREEFLKHQIAVHIDEMFQCQSCNKVFDTKIKFENHVAEVHSNSQYATTAANYNNNNNNSSNSRIDQIVTDEPEYKTEYMLLERAAKGEKARKRTRGPYRKSVSSSSSDKS